MIGLSFCCVWKVSLLTHPLKEETVVYQVFCLSVVLNFIYLFSGKTLFFLSLFILARACMCMHELEEGAERERERGSQAGSHTVSPEPSAELKPMNCEILTWAKIKSRTLN